MNHMELVKYLRNEFEFGFNGWSAKEYTHEIALEIGGCEYLGDGYIKEDVVELLTRIHDNYDWDDWDAEITVKLLNMIIEINPEYVEDIYYIDECLKDVFYEEQLNIFKWYSKGMFSKDKCRIWYADDALDGYIRNNYPKSIITILNDGYLKAVKEILYTIAKFVEEYSSEVIN